MKSQQVFEIDEDGNMEDDEVVLEEPKLREDTLQKILKNKKLEVSAAPSSVFNKTRNLDQTTDSSNIQAQALAKAEALYNKLNIFKGVPLT